MHAREPGTQWRWAAVLLSSDPSLGWWVSRLGAPSASLTRARARRSQRLLSQCKQHCRHPLLSRPPTTALADKVLEVQKVLMLAAPSGKGHSELLEVHDGDVRTVILSVLESDARDALFRAAPLY